MIHYPVFLNANMVERGITKVSVLVGIKGNTDRWTYASKTQTLTCCTYAGTQGLEHEYNAICTSIAAAQKNIEPEIKGIILIDFGGIPYTATLGSRWCGERITIATGSLRAAVQYIL